MGTGRPRFGAAKPASATCAGRARRFDAGRSRRHHARAIGAEPSNESSDEEREGHHDRDDANPDERGGDVRNVGVPTAAELITAQHGVVPERAPSRQAGRDRLQVVPTEIEVLWPALTERTARSKQAERGQDDKDPKPSTAQRQPSRRRAGSRHRVAPSDD